VSKRYIRRKRLRKLIYTLLILTAAASFSNAQEGAGADSRLLAKAETRNTSVTYNIRSGDTFKNDSAKLSPAAYMDETASISLAVREELDAGKSSGLSFDSPSLKAEDLPLVMSSPDRKTVSVVFPPFLYFKTRF